MCFRPYRFHPNAGALSALALYMGQVYQSPEHFLAVLESLKEHLTDTPLPSYDPSGGDDDHPFDVSQVTSTIMTFLLHLTGAFLNSVAVMIVTAPVLLVGFPPAVVVSSSSWRDSTI